MNLFHTRNLNEQSGIDTSRSTILQEQRRKVKVKVQTMSFKAPSLFPASVTNLQQREKGKEPQTERATYDQELIMPNRTHVPI